MTCFKMENGKSLLSWCKENGFHYHMVYRRLDSGMGIKEAIQDVAKMKDSGRKLRSHPVLYWEGKPIVDIYDERSYRLINQRRKRGISLDKAIAMGKLTKRGQK